MQITATLKDAKKIDFGGPCIRGAIYGDTRGRFKDGTVIVTSLIDKIEGEIAYTRFSTYKVEWAAPVTVAV